MVSFNERHHGKFILHYYTNETTSKPEKSEGYTGEEYRLYRFADFINTVRPSIEEYEHYKLKDDVLYNFKLFIHTPIRDPKIKPAQQHSTTMTLMFKITGGQNLKVARNEKIKVVTIDHTKVWNNCRTSERYTNVKSKNSLFELGPTDVIRVLEDTKPLKTLYIVKSHTTPYFNFVTNKLVPTDKWKTYLNKNEYNIHHSMGYIIDKRIKFKFPDETSGQSIDFAVVIHGDLVYHRCLTGLKEAQYIKHNSNGYCNITKNINGVEIKDIIENNIPEQTIIHFDLNDEYIMHFDPNAYSEYKIRGLCESHKRQRFKIMTDNETFMNYCKLILKDSRLVEQSEKRLEDLIKSTELSTSSEEETSEEKEIVEKLEVFEEQIERKNTVFNEQDIERLYRLVELYMKHVRCSKYC